VPSKNQPPRLAIVNIQYTYRQPSFEKVGYCCPVDNTILQASVVQGG